MNIYQFSVLDLDVKSKIVFREAIYLESCADDIYGYSLYFFCSYYIEVIVNHSKRRIDEIVAFKRGERLDKYLKRINVL